MWLWSVVTVNFIKSKPVFVVIFCDHKQGEFPARFRPAST